LIERASATVLALALCLSAATARADDLEDFERARRAYDDQAFMLAVQRFETLVGGETPALQSRPLVLESRKYLGAAYLFVGRRDAAERQFERLLGDDPTYDIDPVAFPAEVITVFAAVRVRVERQRRATEEARRRAEEQARRREAERIIRERERMARLIELAETEREVQENSRWIGLIPFGVGQFQNGHPGVGVAFAVTESVLAVASIITYILHESIRNDIQPLPFGETEPSERRDARVAATGLRISNWVSTALLGAVAVGGIVEAQIRFVPVVETTRRRPLPPDLREGPEVSLSVTGLRLRF